MTTLNIQSFPGEVKISSNLTTDNDSFTVNDVENRVGINIAPTYPLDVNGVAIFEKTDTSVNVLTLKNGNDQLVIKNTNGTNGEIYGYDSGTSSYNKLQLNEDMTILANGNVGIGSSIPTAPLDVKSGDITAEMIAGNIKFGRINLDKVLLGYRGRNINGLYANANGVLGIDTNDSANGEVQWHENGGFKFGLINGGAGVFKFSAGSTAPAQMLHVNGYASSFGGIVKTQVFRRTTVGSFNNNTYTAIHTSDFELVDTGSKGKYTICFVSWQGGHLTGASGSDSYNMQLTSREINVDAGDTVRSSLSVVFNAEVGGGGRMQGNCLCGIAPNNLPNSTNTMRWSLRYARGSTDDVFSVTAVNMTVMQVYDEYYV